MRSHFCWVVVTVAVFIAVAPVRAEEPYQPPDEILRRPELPCPCDIEPQPLALSEAIQIAVRQNLDIELQRQQAQVARAGIGVARGRFEPWLTALYAHSNADTPPSLTLLQQGIATSPLSIDSDLWNVALSAQLPTATQLSVGWTNLRTASSARGAAVTDPLVFNSGLSFSLVQPLLRGFAFDLDIPQADLLRARFASRRAALDVRAALIATIKATEDAYWDLLRALREAEVRRSSRELAQKQQRLSEKLIELGSLPRSDLIAAESTLAQRELAVLEADAKVVRSSNQLRRVLNLPRSDWTRPLLPADAPRYEEPGVNLDESMALALKNRPELAQRRIDIDRASLDVRAARTDRLPTLDVGFSYGMIGQQGTYRDTLDQLISNNVKQWMASASFSWSPLMLASRARVESKVAGHRAAEVQLEQQQLDLLVELRDDLNEIETAARQVRAAARYRELATRTLDVEQRRFQEGTSNNFLIGQRQGELAEAQLAEVDAVIRHRKARTALEAAMGTLIEARGLRLDVGNTGP
jgi:HAE1 family hydrophobic/amphiphilic exporter-1